MGMREESQDSDSMPVPNKEELQFTCNDLDMIIAKLREVQDLD